MLPYRIYMYYIVIINDRSFIQKLAPDQTLYRTILERKPLPVHETAVPNLAIVPSHILLSNTDIELTTRRFPPTTGSTTKSRFQKPGLGWHHGAMDIPRLADGLWQTVAPLLPPRPPRPKGGRPPADDRAALCGILFVLWTGAPWAAVPRGPRLGQPGDLLAAAAGLAGGGRLGSPAPGAAGPPRERRQDRLGAGLPRQRVGAGQGGATAPGATRPTAASRASSCTC
jgi:hypothetical protein